MSIISILYLQGEQISYLYDSRHSLTRRLPLSRRCLEDFLLAYLAPTQGQICSPTHLRTHFPSHLCLNIHCLTCFLSLSTARLEHFLLAFLSPVPRHTSS